MRARIPSPALALVTLALLAGGGAGAQGPAAWGEEPAATSSGNPYSQVGVPAEATAENGVLARERALAAGRRAAWGRLAAELGLSAPPAVSDSQLEAMVASIVIEQERVTPTRYAGRITVNFNPSRARGALGPRASPGGGEAAAGADGAIAAARPTGPASTWLEAVATYRSMEEWVELQRRLRAAGAVASVQVQAIAVDRARLRLGLRVPGPVATEELAGRGVSLAPFAGPGETWRLGLAAGG
jgi:hypothetical protein